MSKKQLCRIGGWELEAVPGTLFAFGGGGACWGPIPLDEVQEGWDVEGCAAAEPIEEK